MVGKRGWWLVALLFTVSILSIMTSRNVEACLTSADCTGGAVCDENGNCVADGPYCNHNTVCQPELDESYPDCSDCPCPSSCSGKSCGQDDDCGTPCYGTCSPASNICYNPGTGYSCCTPSSCPSPSAYACNSTSTTVPLGCGQTCPVTGTSCPANGVCIAGVCKEPCTGMTCATTTTYYACVGGYRSTTTTACPSGMTCTNNNCIYTPSVSISASVSGTPPTQTVTVTATTRGQSTNVIARRVKDSTRDGTTTFFAGPAPAVG